MSKIAYVWGGGNPNPQATANSRVIDLDCIGRLSTYAYSVGTKKGGGDTTFDILYLQC